MLSSLSLPTWSWTYSAARAIVFGESNQRLSVEESPGPPSRVQLPTRAQGSHRGREPSTPHKTPLRRKPQKDLCLQEDGGAMESVGRVIRSPLGMSVHIAAQHAGWGAARRQIAPRVNAVKPATAT
ncbi:hypothetical protein PCASD_09553 [Puccinia coronata f. sp. avenae]|uniref:Uncharacterized protein n=1 Tax=Puccinia coronata f. sp. avenae TaxID=200324 RepID=A0A2N5V2D5_9BASI|nr:hypothetical protein PCASD_09553 [Puccinia coronata f. sp. avenae]